MLKILTEWPDELLEAPATELERLLGGPTLIHLPGRRAAPLFVSVLLHGNEYSGFEAIQSVLSNHRKRPLPRAMSIFVGNVAAAARGLRRLDHQPDYNRVWPGAEDTGSVEHAMMRDVVERMRERGVFASIDLHNNTGLNPHYGCVSRLDRRALHLARLFSRIVVYFTRPLGVQSMAFAPMCPAVTLECGKPGDPAAARHAADVVQAALHLEHFPEHPIAPQDVDLYHTVGIVKVPDAATFRFDGTAADIAFDGDLDRMNFRELAAGTRIARIAPNATRPLDVSDESGRDVFDRYFETVEGELRTRCPVVPAMLTLDERVIRQDCLCYLMERLPIRGADSEA